MRLHPLPRLLATLGLVKATGLLEIERRRLRRRIVFSCGSVSAIVSNARDDRLFEWALAQGRIAANEAVTESVLAELGDRPLVSVLLIKAGLIDADELAGLMRDHLLGLLEETSGWSDARFTITPGKVQLDGEPSVPLQAVEAALLVARHEIGRNKAIVSIPEWLVAGPPAGDDEPKGLDAAERAILGSCTEPRRRDALRSSLSEFTPQELDTGLRVLARVGLIQATHPSASRLDQAELAVDADEIAEFLKAAESEDFFRILGVGPKDDIETVRRAYYIAVKRFHPDRFRQGELSAHHDRIEKAFRLLHEAVQVLADPAARLELQREKASQQRTDPDHEARSYLAQARKIAGRDRRVEAAEVLERGLSRTPGHVGLELNLALLLLGNPIRRAEALSTLERLVRENPTRVDVSAYHALALKSCGRMAEAARATERARELAPDQPLVRALDGDEAGRAATARNPFVAHLL